MSQKKSAERAKNANELAKRQARYRDRIVLQWPDLAHVVESLLFIADKPLTDADIVEVLLRQHAEEVDQLDEEGIDLFDVPELVEAKAEAVESGPAANEDVVDAKATVLAEAPAQVELGFSVVITEADGSVMIDDTDDSELPPDDERVSLAEESATSRLGEATQSASEETPADLSLDAASGAAATAVATESGVLDESGAETPATPADTGQAAFAADSSIPEIAGSGDAVAGAGVASEDVAGDSVTGESVTGDSVAVPAAALDEVVSAALKTDPLAPLRKHLLQEVKAAVARLTDTYSRRAGFDLVTVAGGYQLRTSATVAGFVRQFLQVKPTRLSRAQLETLAIVAYRQPVTRPEIEQIRGVDCGAAMKILLERKLVRILGKKEEVGRPLLYGTTKEFLEFFNLKSLMELPTLREFQELSEEHQRKVEEELDRDKPLGSMKELAEQAPALAVDDSAMIGDLDAALQNARRTVNRVAEVTGLKPIDEEGAPGVSERAGKDSEG